MTKKYARCMTFNVQQVETLGEHLTDQYFRAIQNNFPLEGQ